MRGVGAYVALSISLVVAIAAGGLWLANPEFELPLLGLNLVLLSIAFSCCWIAFGPACRRLQFKGIFRTWRVSALIVLGVFIGTAALSLSRSSWIWNFRKVESQFAAMRDDLVAGKDVQFPVQIGRFDVQFARSVNGGVFFCLSRNPDSELGIAWSPSGAPPDIGSWVKWKNSVPISDKW